MDITFQSNQQKFNYRVCGMDSRWKNSCHAGRTVSLFYLPGGRVKLR